jgi:hypothetical protein
MEPVVTDVIRQEPNFATGTLQSLQRDSFAYFIHEANPANGMVVDKTLENWPASNAAIVMALTVYPIGVEHHFMSCNHAVQRTMTTPRFLVGSEQSTAPDATGYKG